ncbi:Ribosome-binding ATPase YchF [uncultured archaeon]|nr:Ribosome-binding ATPase YchF [uncultured archaeon]
MQIGLVGKPSAGKSTFFAAATLMDVAIAAYPFTTIEPNKGIGFVRVECIDKELNTQCNPRSGLCHDHIRYVPIELIDVAGLVPGASQGKGMGNQFLDDLRQADVLIHVVDASGSTNEKGEIVAPGTHDPLKDVEFLEEELNTWFYQIIQKNLKKIARMTYESKAKMIEAMSQGLSGIGVTQRQVARAADYCKLGEKKLVDWTDEDYKNFSKKIREESKPIIIAANKADKPQALENIKRIKEIYPDKIIIGCSAISELTLRKAARDGSLEYYSGNKDFKALKELSEQQKQGLDYIKLNVLAKLDGTGVQKILDYAVFNVLQYKAIFPAGTKNLADQYGNVLPDCFLMPPEATALDFAFKLHSDIGNGFIKAIDVKTRQLIGKDTILKNRDAVEIFHK